MKGITKEARGFVSGVMGYLKGERKAKSMMPKMQKLLSKVTEQARVARTATVMSAVKLTKAEEAKVGKFLGTLVGHSVSIRTEVHEDLLGGVRIQVADWIIDTSIKTQIQTIGRLLLS